MQINKEQKQQLHNLTQYPEWKTFEVVLKDVRSRICDVRNKLDLDGVEPGIDFVSRKYADKIFETIIGEMLPIKVVKNIVDKNYE